MARIHPAEYASGNIFIRSNTLEFVGDTIDGHTHNFDHTSIVFTGAVHVKAKTPDGRVIEQDFTAPAHFLGNVVSGATTTITLAITSGP